MMHKDKDALFDEVYKKLDSITKDEFDAIHAGAYIITAQHLYKTMAKGPYRSFRNHIVDSKYRVLSSDDWIKALNLLSVNQKHYQSEFFDCDDFALVSKGLLSFVFEINGCGWVCDYAGGHSFLNVVVVDSKQNLSIGVIEPQENLYIKKYSDAYINVGNGLVIW